MFKGIFAATLLFAASTMQAAGLLTPVSGNLPPLEIKDHQVSVIIEDGYAITTVEQVFHNPHAQDLEAIYAHAPGLKILYPSTPQDAFNAVLAAWEDDNPVLVFEHKRLYRSQKGPVQFDPDYRSIWHPRQIRSGQHATLVTYGEMVHLAEKAVAYLETEYDLTFDLFDLRALAPLDLDPIRASLARTHRLAVIHEGRGRAGFGAELVSQLVETQFFDLEAPPLRITSLDTPVPFAAELEAIYRPSVESITEQLIEWME